MKEFIEEYGIIIVTVIVGIAFFGSIAMLISVFGKGSVNFYNTLG